MHNLQSRTDKDALDARTSERLSRRLKLARQLRGMTLKTLADAARCSESLLSKIENGKAYPSLPMLNRLVGALDMNMGWIFDAHDGTEPVIFRADRRLSAGNERSGRSITVEAVIPEAAKRLLQCNIYHVEAGASSGGDNQHTGEEVGYLLEGQLELLIGGRPHRLRAGDAFAFHSEQPHSYRNVGATRATVFWVATPPPT